MNILIVDDERMAAEDLKETILKVKENAFIGCFDNYRDAFFEAKDKVYDVAFLDIAMPGKNGLELAKALKEINGKINIIFVTGYSDYAVQAFQINASGYILKPADVNEVKNALDNLRIPVVNYSDGLRVQCFGEFEVYYGNEKIIFKRNKAKEIFAYLVNLKGKSANTNEICAAIFEEENISKKHYFRNLIAELKDTLQKYGVSDVFIYERNSFAINPQKLDCDYYKFLMYDIDAVNSYNGEYMKQYSWAEMTNGYLNSEKDNIEL